MSRNPNGTGSYLKLKDGRIRWRQQVDGKPRNLYGRTPKELQEKVKKVSGLPTSSGKLTVDDWFIKWLDAYILPLKKKATYNSYEYLYRVHIKPVIGHRKMNGLKPYDVQSVIAKMHMSKMASKVMKEAKGVMNRAFNKAIDEGILSTNPVYKIAIPIKQKKPQKILTFEELSRLYKAMDNSRWLWAVRLMLVTGLRRGELLALRWSDIDFTGKRLTVDESNSRTGLGETKSAKEHYVPLSDKAIECLNKQKLQLKNESNRTLFESDPLVFPGEHGAMIRPDSFYTMLTRFAKKAGIQAHPHSLRHSFVYYTRKSLSLKELQYALGHDESTTTTDIYGDILDDSTIETAAQIDSVFDKVENEIERIEADKAAKKKGKVIPFRKTV